MIPHRISALLSHHGSIRRRDNMCSTHHTIRHYLAVFLRAPQLNDVSVIYSVAVFHDRCGLKPSIPGFLRTITGEAHASRRKGKKPSAPRDAPPFRPSFPLCRASLRAPSHHGGIGSHPPILRAPDGPLARALQPERPRPLQRRLRCVPLSHNTAQFILRALRHPLHPRRTDAAAPAAAASAQHAPVGARRARVRARDARERRLRGRRALQSDDLHRRPQLPRRAQRVRRAGVRQLGQHDGRRLVRPAPPLPSAPGTD